MLLQHLILYTSRKGKGKVYIEHRTHYIMNIIKERQADRINKIKQMEESIKKAENPDYDRLVMLACSHWGISLRTVKEYLKIAKFNVENEAR